MAFISYILPLFIKKSRYLFLRGVLVSSLLIGSCYGDQLSEFTAQQGVETAKREARNNNPLIKEAVKAVAYTREALFALHLGNQQEGIKALQQAILQLNVLLNTPNAPYLLPVDVQIQVVQFIGDREDIARLAQRGKELVNRGLFPKARQILDSLRSEIVIKTINLPLSSYPPAIQLAIRYLNKGKVEEARDILGMVLTTLVEVDRLIPIPLIKAQTLVEGAERLSKTNRKEALIFLREAKRELERARLLGYTSKTPIGYKKLEQEITRLETGLQNGEEITFLFQTLIKDLKEFKEKGILVYRR